MPPLGDAEREMKRVTILLMISIVIAGVMCASWRKPLHGIPVPTPTVTVTEDDPGWDCRTMGNRTCAPGTRS